MSSIRWIGASLNRRWYSPVSFVRAARYGDAGVLSARTARAGDSLARIYKFRRAGTRRTLLEDDMRSLSLSRNNRGRARAAPRINHRARIIISRLMRGTIAKRKGKRARNAARQSLYVDECAGHALRHPRRMSPDRVTKYLKVGKYITRLRSLHFRARRFPDLYTVPRLRIRTARRPISLIEVIYFRRASVASA